MRLRLWAWPALLAPLAIAHTAGAVAPHRIDHRQIEATPAAKAGGELRQHVRVSSAVPTVRQRAWDDFVTKAGPRWTATWDVATGVPSRLYGGSIHIPGSNASPWIAEQAARAFLGLHLDLLAPGVTLDDLELVSNHDDGRIRTLGFYQHHQGWRVVGGQISVRFLNDRLYVVSSQILPDVRLPDNVAGPVLSRAAVRSRARAAMVEDLALAGAQAQDGGDEVILPLVSDDAVLGYRIAVPVEIDAGVQGGWRAYADPTTGEVLVRRSTRAYADGTLVFDAPVRWPGTTRQDYVAQGVKVTVGGASTTTSMNGTLSWTPDSTVSLITTVEGNQVRIQNSDDEGLDEASATLSIAPAGTARWSEAASETKDAQIATFVHAQIAKEYARTLSPGSSFDTFLDEEMRATVNIDASCNAFYSGGSINFYAASDECENTGRLADVVYHEFGHGVHDHMVIPGVGEFPSETQEGTADFFAGMITGDAGMGRGFHHSDSPLRDLDPLDIEAVWPEDLGEVHQSGLIYGGAMWDLRKIAILQLGEEAGIELVERIFVATMQRGTDTPSTFIEALAADDDDGDLGNGTPHECMIREAFGHHGMRTATAVATMVPVVAGTTDETASTVTLDIGGLSEACPGDELMEVSIAWNPRADGQTPLAGTTVLEPMEGDVYVASVPLPDPGDVVELRFKVKFNDLTEMIFPDNRGDPNYQIYRGDLVELYCTDFEDGSPFEGDLAWTTETDGGPDLWEWDAPTGASGDPASAFSGTRVLGLALEENNGAYAPDTTTRITSPTIDVGDYSDVRLHYRRWLGVEDGYFDDARVYANEERIWQNFDSASDGNVHSKDKEWVFRDHGLSTRIFDGTVHVSFELESDGGLEMGGWTIDDFCIVADPNAICGDGTINGVEQCDEGAANADEADVCRTNCRVPRCGDSILDSPEQCDDGNREDGDSCNSICELPGGGGGCCSTGTDPMGAVLPTLLVAGGLFVRRRRRRS